MKSKLNSFSVNIVSLYLFIFIIFKILHLFYRQSLQYTLQSSFFKVQFLIHHSLSSFKPSSNSSFTLSSKQSYQILFPFLVSIFSSSSESFISQLLHYSAPSSESLLLTESIRNELYLQFIQIHSDFIPTTLHSFLSKNSTSLSLFFISSYSSSIIFSTISISL